MAIDSLNDLYLFGRVVEAGGFAAAERQTGIPKSRLSRRIAALEKELNVRLIHRTAHRFQVTDFDLVQSTIKIRKAGFADCEDSHESLLRNLARLRRDRYIP